MSTGYFHSVGEHTRLIVDIDVEDVGLRRQFAILVLDRWLLGQRVEAERDFDQCLKLNPELKPLLEERVQEMKRRLGTQP